MRNYLKLVNFELNRFIKIYVVLMAVTAVIQMAGVIVQSRRYLSEANEQINQNLMSVSSFIEQYGPISFAFISRTWWFIGPIIFCIAVLVIYVFFIWYRDWFGKNTFIYRLLMLPTDRLNIYLAKATTIFLMVLGLISLQLILLPIESTVFQMMIPTDFRVDFTLRQMIKTFDDFGILFPSTFADFVIHYLLGFIAVFVVFTAILFERSYKWKGILFGVLYCVGAVVVFFAPAIIAIILEKSYLYPIEYFFLQIILGLLVIGMSLWTSRFLLQKKITV